VYEGGAESDRCPDGKTDKRRRRIRWRGGISTIEEEEAVKERFK
jgi:hypothetical protein